jgi:hypothetical protein
LIMKLSVTRWRCSHTIFSKVRKESSCGMKK